MSHTAKWRRLYNAIQRTYLRSCATDAKTWREVFHLMLNRGFTQPQLDRWLCCQTSPGEIRRRRRDALKAAVQIIRNARAVTPPEPVTPRDQASPLRALAATARLDPARAGSIVETTAGGFWMPNPPLTSNPRSRLDNTDQGATLTPSQGK